MFAREWFYRWYAHRLRRRLPVVPGHVALVMDGNRRWAKQMGFENPSIGHRYGAQHLREVLNWCAGLGIPQVTIYVASADNLRKRGAEEVSHLLEMIEQIVAEDLCRQSNQWRLHVAGRLEALPDSTAHALKTARDTTAERELDHHLTIAIAYDGHEEIVDAVRTLVDREAEAGTDIVELAQRLSSDDIAAHLHAGDRPDPDLVIRTSGERRMSSFLLWQTAHSELYFCDVYWPGFRYVDFLRALRDFAARITASS